MLRFRHAQLTHGINPLSVLVTSPTEDIVLGRERLDQLRTVVGPSAIDQEIVAQAKVSPPGTRISILAANDDETQREWRFCPSLQPGDVAELCDLLIRSQLWVYRRLLAIGFCMHVRVDLHSREQVGLRNARDRLLRDPAGAKRAATTADESYPELDLWIVRNFLYYFALPLDKVMGPFLSENVGTIDRRMERARRQRQHLPAELVREISRDQPLPPNKAV